MRKPTKSTDKPKPIASKPQPDVAPQSGGTGNTRPPPNPPKP